MLVVDGNNRKVGYDPELDKDFDEIPGSQMDTIIGGLGIDMPHYRLPYDPKGKPLTVIFSGADLKKESTMDFVYSGPGFTVGFDDIRLDPGEVLVAVISQNGEKLGMALSNDGVMPEVYYAVDTPKKSYMAEIKRNGAVAGKAATGSMDLKKIRVEIGGSTIFGAMRQIKFDPKTEPPVFAVNFDDGAGKLQITDNSAGDSSYDVDLEQFDATGKTDKIQLNDVGANDGGANDYEIEVGEWNGGSKIEVKHDAAGDGFDNDPEVEQDNAPNNITDDPDKDTAGLFIKFIENSLTW